MPIAGRAGGSGWGRRRRNFRRSLHNNLGRRRRDISSGRFLAGSTATGAKEDNRGKTRHTDCETLHVVHFFHISLELVVNRQPEERYIVIRRLAPRQFVTGPLL